MRRGAVVGWEVRLIGVESAEMLNRGKSQRVARETGCRQEEREARSERAVE